MGECGYWNLTRKENGLGIYYQFFLEEKTIVAKGFNLDIDEIPITLKDSLITEATFINLTKEHPIDIEYVKSKLSSFKIKDIVFKSPFGSYIEIELVDTKDSVYQASIMMLFENDKIVRQLSYFNSSERHR
jgi:hypothetical protein